MCFQSYVAKRTKGILSEFTSAVGDTTGPPAGVRRDDYGNIITWLGLKLTGLPAPPTSAHITNQHVHQMLSATPQDSLFRTSRSMKKCADTRDQLPARQRHSCLPELLGMGLDTTRSYERYYCLCNAHWQGSQEYRHCWGCHQCRLTDSWHCGTCHRCVHGSR